MDYYKIIKREGWMDGSRTLLFYMIGEITNTQKYPHT